MTILYSRQVLVAVINLVWVALKRAEFLVESCLFLARLLGQENGLDVWQDTTLGNGDTAEEFVQLFVIADGQLQVTWDDTGLLVVTGSVTGQLKDLSAQILQNGGQVDWGTGTNTLGVVALAQQTVNTADGELKSGAD